MSVRRAAMAAMAAAFLVAVNWAARAEPAFSADQLQAILMPTKVASKTRSLTPGEGTAAAPRPGEPGSGRVPDLKLLFKFNSATLLPEATAQLDSLADAIQRDDMVVFSFELAGHTDAAGSASYNKKLSQQRAQAAVAYLVQKHNVDPARLRAEGFGEEQLADSTNPNSPKNRRVEVVTIQ